MDMAVKIEGGFAEVEAGEWLVSRGQPAAFLGSFRRLRRTGLFVRDRAVLDRVRTGGRSRFSSADAPFLTHIPCVDRVHAVSGKVLVAPASARIGAEMLKPIPMSVGGAFCVTVFGLVEERRSAEGAQRPESETALPSNSLWLVVATRSRTSRLVVEDGQTLSARPDAVVAWTGNRPTGFCAKLGLLDLVLPVAPRELFLNFHGPCVVWIEGAKAAGRIQVGRRAYGA